MARQTGPKPFSKAWLQEPLAPPVRRVPALPSWVPSDRRLAGLLVILLALSMAMAGNGDGTRGRSIAAPVETESAAVIATPGETASVQATNTAQPTPPTPTATTDPAVNQPAPTATHLPDITIKRPGNDSETDELLPKYRIVAYYGHPNNTNMGVLGEFPNDPEAMLAALREEAARYEAADPTKPVKMALEVIASAAQNEPAENNTYLRHTDPSEIDALAEFCEENGLLLILDVQIGHSTVKDEIESVRRWLEKPFVHLALDPEFAMPKGVVPGKDIGGIDAADVAYAQDTLGQIVDQFGLPPKLLIVHRFTEGMIRDDHKIEAVPGVQLVIDFDGFGEPAVKSEFYNHFTAGKGVEFAGIKLFYTQDAPLMTPSEVVALEPSPVFVVYH